MFFKKIQCPNCKSLHDEMNEFCPFCGTPNEVHADFRKAHPMTFIPWWKELIFALTGLIGFTVINVLVSLFLSMFLKEQMSQDEVYALMMVNTISYLLFFMICCLILIPHWKVVLNKFKIGFAYLFGLAGYAVLIAFSIGYGYLVEFLKPGSQGGNQAAVSSMVVNYPLISILILGLIGPICEEVAYRLGLFTLLRRIHPALAYASTALIFGMIHFDFTAPDLSVEFLLQVDYIFAGLVFSFLYEKKGFAASTFAHVLNNMMSILLIIWLGA